MTSYRLFKRRCSRSLTINTAYHSDLDILKGTFDSRDESAVYVDVITASIAPSRIRLLDVGVGAGVCTMSLMDTLKELGYDVALTMVDPAVPTAAKNTLETSGRLYETYLEHFKNQTRYEVVKATQVLYYLGDQHKALDQLIALMAHDGSVLAITTWTAKCVLYELYDCFFRGYRPGYTAEDTRDLLSEISGCDATLLRTPGVVRTGDWKRDEAACRASYRMISRSLGTIDESSYERYRETILGLPDVSTRENGTVVLNTFCNKTHYERPLHARN